MLINTGSGDRLDLTVLEKDKLFASRDGLEQVIDGPGMDISIFKGILDELAQTIVFLHIVAGELGLLALNDLSFASVLVRGISVDLVAGDAHGHDATITLGTIQKRALEEQRGHIRGICGMDGRCGNGREGKDRELHER